MTFRTALCGLALVILGVGSYLQSSNQAQSPTALIPAGFGVALLLCAAAVAAKESLRKHVMHFAAMIGLLGVIGGFVPILRTVAKGLEVEIAKPAIASGLLMSAVCAVYVMLCVQSFIAARKDREAKV